MWLLPNGERKLIKEMHDNQLEMRTDQKWIMCEIQKMREEAMSEDGYVRCGQRKIQLVELEKRQADLSSKLKWIRNTFVGGLISSLVAGVVVAGNYLFK